MKWAHYIFTIYTVCWSLHDYDIAKFPIKQFTIKIYLEWIILRRITLHRYSAAINMSWQCTASNCIHSLFNHFIHLWSAFKFSFLLYVNFSGLMPGHLGQSVISQAGSLTVKIGKKANCLSHGLWSTTIFKHHWKLLK